MGNVDTAPDMAALKKKAARLAALKRKVKPVDAEIDKLGEELKDFFRANPSIVSIGPVGFSVSHRKQLDVKAVRAELGDRIASFERDTTVESLSILGGAR